MYYSVPHPKTTPRNDSFIFEKNCVHEIPQAPPSARNQPFLRTSASMTIRRHDLAILCVACIDVDTYTATLWVIRKLGEGMKITHIGSSFIELLPAIL